MSTPQPSPFAGVTLAALRGRRSLKWSTYPADVLPLWVAEMDVAVAEPVARALHDAVDRSDLGYPPESFAYAEALAGLAERRWGWDGLDPARSRVVPDVMQGVSEMIDLVTRPGDAVVVTTPVYPPFFDFLARAGRQARPVPLTPAHRLDLDALEEAFARHDTTAVLLASPHNPTGTVHTPAELAAVAQAARRHRVRVVVDEIHAPLVLPGATFTPFLAVEGGDDALVVTSASKAWNLAGLKAAVAVAGPGAAADLARLPEVVGHGPSALGILAHTVAIEEGGPWLDAVLAHLASQRELLGELLAERLPAVRWRPHEGTYLAWLDVSRLRLGDQPAAALVDRARVAFSEGVPFGGDAGTRTSAARGSGAGCVRVNTATTRAILVEAIERVAAVVGDAGERAP